VTNLRVAHTADLHDAALEAVQALLVDVFQEGEAGGTWPPALEAAVYLSETSSIRKLVGSVMSVVARNWIRTVWPSQLARLNDFCE
jgi:hypothetical protein